MPPTEDEDPPSRPQLVRPFTDACQDLLPRRDAMDPSLVRREVRASQIVDVIVDHSRDDRAPLEVGLLGPGTGQLADVIGVTDGEDPLACDRDGAGDREILVHGQDLAVIENTIRRLRTAQAG